MIRQLLLAASLAITSSGCGLPFTSLASFAPASIDRAQSGAPSISQVDPPGWWIGHSLKPVMLLLRGRNLQSATLKTNAPGIGVTPLQTSSAGDYLIANLTIDPAQAVPSTIRIMVETAQGAAAVDFTLEALPSSAGRYQGFTPDDVIYLVMIDRFADGDPANNDPAISAGYFNRNNPFAYHGGDLKGLIERLDYLRELGVTALWLTPVNDNYNRGADYHGYGAVDFYGVDEHFGDVALYRELVAQAHARGIKVIQDQVLNHTGPNHPWTDSPPTPTFLNGSRASHLNNPFDIASLVVPNGNPTQANATLRGWFLDLLPDLNQDDPVTTQYLIQKSLWWIARTGMDGIRADTFPYVPRSFWAKWMTAIKAEHPSFTVVGEVYDGRPSVVSFFQGGEARFDGIDSKLDTVFDFPSAFTMRDYFSRGQNTVAGIVNGDFVYPRPEVLVPFLNNHDIPRFANESGWTPEKQILALTYLLTMRGTPQLFYGDEIGLPGGNDPDNRRDFPGGFPGDSRSAFSAGGRTESEQQIFAATQQLLAIRRAHPALRGGEMRFLLDNGGRLSYLRRRDGDVLLCAINNNATPASWTLTPPAGTWAENTVLIDLLGRAADLSVKQGQLTVSLPAQSAAIYHAASRSNVATSVSAASFQGNAPLAPESIAAAFGLNLSTQPLGAPGTPLPFTLAGTTLRIRDKSGVERLSPLFYVSPEQINFLVPGETAIGAASVTVTNGQGEIALGTITVSKVAPGLFAANANGAGVAAGFVVRVKADGSQSSESIYQVDPNQPRYIPVPIDLGNETDQVYLVLFGTGLRFGQTTNASIAGMAAQVVYAGPQPEYLGLDQINLLLPRSLAGKGEVEVILTANGIAANPVRIGVK